MDSNIIKRLSPTSETIRKLLLRSGNRCAFPNCQDVIFNDKDELVAECCHIEAALPGGERYNPNQTIEERRAIDNLLFLCGKHHVETNNEVIYTVDFLKEIKYQHESQFRESPILINSNHVQQVSQFFEQLLRTVEQTLGFVQQIDSKQDEILSLLSAQLNSEKDATTEHTLEYFGIPPIFQFQGRAKELDALATGFQAYNFFIVEGISGVGKSSILAKFLQDIGSHKPLWIDCDTVQTKEAFYSHLAKFLKQEFGDSSLARATSSNDDEANLRAVVHALNVYDCCIVLDGLNAYAQELSPMLNACSTYVRGSKILVSTNVPLNTIGWLNPVYRLRVEGLDESAFLQLLDLFGLSENIGVYRQRLFRLLNGHPFLLKLVAPILSVQPVEQFIAELEAERHDEIDGFIGSKALTTLSDEERTFLEILSAFVVPFRYDIGGFLPGRFAKCFQVLRAKFLVESYFDKFFIIPEFIRLHVLKSRDCLESSASASAFIKYLQSIKGDVRLFEREALVEWALEINEVSIAKDEAIRLLSNLMSNGDFLLALRIAQRLTSHELLADWGWPYFVQGRVLRFHEDYSSALLNYDKALALGATPDEANGCRFEKASMLTYQSKVQQNDALYKEAEVIYRELSKLDDPSMAVQSKLSLITHLMWSHKFNEAVRDMERLIEEVNIADVQINVVAGMWQLLGDAYSKSKQYEKAFVAFDKSIEFYKLAIAKFGMNVLDGLFHLYESYGWTFSVAGDHDGAIEMFGICVSIASNFGLENKKEKVLFDLGYNYIMAGQFVNATQALSDHYSLLVTYNLIDESDMPFIHGSLAFAHWYAGSFIEAIELLGLYFLSCYRRDINPRIVIWEEEGQDTESQKIDVRQHFSKRTYIFSIPLGKSFADLKSWVSTVIAKRPELEEALGSLHYLKKD